MLIPDILIDANNTFAWSEEAMDKVASMYRMRVEGLIREPKRRLIDAERLVCESLIAFCIYAREPIATTTVKLSQEY